MSLRSIMVGTAVLGATFALAAGVLQFAEGRGIAKDSKGRRAHFQFDARKFVDGDIIRKSGQALYEISDRETVDGVRIYMRELRDIVVDGNKARFEGPGGIRFRTRRGLVERFGHVVGYAQDNRKPTGPIEPRDRVAVFFRSADGKITYSFEGNVFEGDVAVGKREGS